MVFSRGWALALPRVKRTDVIVVLRAGRLRATPSPWVLNRAGAREAARWWGVNRDSIRVRETPAGKSGHRNIGRGSQKRSRANCEKRNRMW